MAGTSKGTEKKDDIMRDDSELTRKVFCDPVHGHIKLHPLLVKIINTPEFERLRFIKQLGGVYFVYPGASHNRFEHSIGTCHLAGEFVRALKTKQTDKPGESKISEKDVLCVEIAALCHDLGHGPFSHLFDEMVVPEICPEENRKKHEDLSIDVFKYMLNSKENDLKTEFKKYGLDTEEPTDEGSSTPNDIVFIRELINRKKGEECKGRSTDKHFLYEIVSNKTTGVDVDKWDYLARDCLMLGMKSNFSHTRAIEFSKVLYVVEKGQEKGKFEICFRDKEAPTLYDMYSVRNTIHRRACHHKTVEVVQIMIADAIIAAEKSKHKDFKFKGKDGKLCTISEALCDVDAYLQMTDDILMKIYHADPTDENDELKKAKDLVKRLLRRNLYKFAGSKLFKKDQALKEKTRDEMHKIVDKLAKDKKDSFVDHEKARDEMLKIDEQAQKTKDNIVVHVVEFNFGKQDENPLNSVKFFTKANPDKAIKLPPEKISYFLQDVFYEQQVLVYCKNADFSDAVNEVFNLWKENIEEEDKEKERQREHMQQ